MTEQELKQLYFDAPASQLLPIFQASERALNLLYPCAVNYVELKAKKEQCSKDLDTAKKAKKGKLLSLIGFLGAALLFFILSNGAGGIGAFFCRLISIFCLVCAFAVVAIHLGDKKTIKNCSKELPELEKQVAAALAQVEQIKNQHSDVLYIRQIICPPETLDPKYMRVFTQFFEAGRASSLKEALNLFAEYMHRERMENMASAQVQASYAAQQAAYAAMEASQNAASSANAARAAATSAEYITRMKD